ncbi:MAG: serine hydrolase [Chloroflexi bacterium]|nr:serine hydrolase [Chloroflexota bacterium]
MNRRSSPGVGQWFSVTILVVTTFFLIFKLVQYATFSGTYPTGLTIAAVDVGGLSPTQASEVLANRYIEAPIIIFHGEQSYEVSPTEAEFQLDLDTMLSQADDERSRQDFWAGFWGFLWGRPIEINPIPILATHDREALIRVLSDIKNLMDVPAQPPQPVPDTLSFQYGEAGTETNILASLDDVEAALYRPLSRESHLIIEPKNPERPELNLLIRLLVNQIQEFEQETGGIGSLFILDLETGDEIPINADIAMSGIDLLKVPIVLEMYRQLDRLPTLAQNELISNTLVIQVENESANSLLRMIAGQDDSQLGAQLVTHSIQRLGLQNSYIAAPYDLDPEPGTAIPATPANSVEERVVNADPYIQTTAEDIGTLMSMIYYCAEGNGGALQAAFGEQITQAECQTMLAFMSQNKIGSLIEEGVPPDINVAHRHGWISDTHADAGIVYTPAANYVIVQILYKPDWLEWELSSPLLADISRATYNYFNFDNPYLSDSRSN